MNNLVIEGLRQLTDPNQDIAAAKEIMAQKVFHSILEARKITDAYEENPGLYDNPEKIKADAFRLSSLLIRIDQLAGLYEGQTNPKVIEEAIKITEADIAQSLRAQAMKDQEAGLPIRRITEDRLKQMIRSDPRYCEAVTTISRACGRATILRRTAAGLHEFLWTMRIRSRAMMEENRDSKNAW